MAPPMAENLNKALAMKANKRREGHDFCWRNSKKHTVYTILFVLFSCNLLLRLLNKLHSTSPTSYDTLHAKTLKLQPISFIASRLLAVFMAYASIFPYTNHLSLSELLSKIQRTWRRPAITILYIELIATAASSLLMTLAAFARATRGVALEVMLVLSSIASLLILSPVLFAHSDMACKIGLVVSVIEDSEGISALERAGDLIRERKLQGFVLGSVLMLLEQVPLMVFGHGEDGNGWMIGGLVLLLAHVAMKFVGSLVYTGFYYECRERERFS